MCVFHFACKYKGAGSFVTPVTEENGQPAVEIVGEMLDQRTNVLNRGEG